MLTMFQQEILGEIESISLFGIAQAARESWESGVPYYCRVQCPFGVRLRLAEGNDELLLPHPETDVALAKH